MDEATEAYPYNQCSVFSDVPDLTSSAIDTARYPSMGGLRLFDVALEPGEGLFLPVGWWQPVLALDFSISATYTDFAGANPASEDYPSR